MIGEALAATARIAFLTGGAPIAGATLLLAIARVTGAAWEAATPLTILLPLLAVAAALLGFAQLASPAPPSLAGWMHPLAVAARGAAVGVAWWYVGGRLRGGASITFAAVALALYALLATPIAGDWLLGHVPGHTVSSAGMMLATEQILAACALLLVIGAGDRQFGDDMSQLMVAAALGLGYLVFVDYLVIWYGNLPTRVGFYIVRSRGAAATLPPLALLLGWVVPIALLWRGGAAARRWAGGSTLAALFLVHCWWVGGGPVAWLAAAALIAVAAGAILRRERQAHHG